VSILVVYLNIISFSCLLLKCRHNDQKCKIWQKVALTLFSFQDVFSIYIIQLDKYIMINMNTRVYNRVSMSDRVRIISLRDRRTSVKSISKILKIKESTAKHIISKWNLYDTIEDRPKYGRPVALSDRSTRVLVRNI
jgi:hypothetical protein